MDLLGIVLVGFGVLSIWCGVKGTNPKTVVTNFIVNPGLPAGQEHPSASSGPPTTPTPAPAPAPAAGGALGGAVTRPAAGGGIGSATTTTAPPPHLTTNAVPDHAFIAPADHKGDRQP